MRKRIVLLIACCVTVLLAMNSCRTGFSKGSYISSLERFVSSVEQDYKGYDNKDWERADERMTAFVEKYEKFEDKFTSEERRNVSKLMTKYEVIRSKAKVSGFFKGIGDIIDDGMGTIEGVLEGLGGSSSEEKNNI